MDSLDHAMPRQWFSFRDNGRRNRISICTSFLIKLKAITEYGYSPLLSLKTYMERSFHKS